MCTIITLFQVHPAFPLVIAANRDERYARPSRGPAVLADPPAVVAGRDLDFGGTWFGVNARGVAVAVADQGLGERPRGTDASDPPRDASRIARRAPMLGGTADSPPSPPMLGGADERLAAPAPVAEGAARDDAGGAALAAGSDLTTAAMPAPARRSRGLLVLDALGCSSGAAVSDLLAGVTPADYNPFTLLHADAHQASIGHHVEGPVRLRALTPGLDVMVSAIGADHANWRSAYVTGALDPARLAALDSAALVEVLQAVLRHHAAADGRDDAICRHHADSGTVSSFVALLAPDLAASQLHCALGPPCRTAYADYSALLHELAGVRV